MKQIQYKQLSYDLLADKERLLFDSALSIRKNSYSPYSGFAVGAAVMLETGDIIKAANQENEAYPSGLCAERIALFFAGSSFPDKKITAIAIAAADEKSRPMPAVPCGACLQVMSEYEKRSGIPMNIIFMQDDNQLVVVQGVANLLPFIFKMN